ncbi:MAG: hypothetical protein PHX13_12255 [Thiovulaceae bacterium]|nr:hypothetical protein [Sulfurimonadaceae bacterium]
MNFLQSLSDMLKDGTLSDSLNTLGKVAGVFNPVLGSGLVMASNITDQIADVPDDFLQKDVIGLSGCADRLQKMVDSKNVDFNGLELIVKNLNSIAVFTQKSAKLIS